MISDETLMAYADGELDPGERAKVEAEAAASPDIAARLAQHRRLAERLRETFDPVLEEPVPGRLATLVRQGGVAGIVDLAQARERRRRDVPTGWTGGLMAACLAAGLAVGVGLDRSAPRGAFAAHNGALVAAGPLAASLDQTLVAAQDTRAPIRIGFSIRSADGRYCRTFIDSQIDSAGLACRNGAAWRLQATASLEPATRTAAYRTAADSLPASVLEAAQDVAAGPPLDAAQEAAARARGWRAAKGASSRRSSAPSL